MAESHALLITEITTLRTRLSEAEAENARLKKHRETDLDHLEELSIALREALERHAKSDACREENWQMVLAERSKREEAERDSWAYQGALGYPVPGWHDGRKTDGTIPQCGLCDARNRALPSQEKPSDKEKPE